eukprot:Pgem_evm1s906
MFVNSGAARSQFDNVHQDYYYAPDNENLGSNNHGIPSEEEFENELENGSGEEECQTELNEILDNDLGTSLLGLPDSDEDTDLYHNENIIRKEHQSPKPSANAFQYFNTPSRFEFRNQNANNFNNDNNNNNDNDEYNNNYRVPLSPRPPLFKTTNNTSNITMNRNTDNGNKVQEREVKPTLLQRISKPDLQANRSGVNLAPSRYSFPTLPENFNNENYRGGNDYDMENVMDDRINPYNNENDNPP